MKDQSTDLVSVVMPLYNGEKYVKQALDSALAQSYTNLEIVVIDDGSTDKSVDIVKEYGDKVTLVIQKNSGPASARNNGVEVANGKWIAFLDSDDIWLPNKLETQLAKMHDVVWSYCDSCFMGGANDGLRDSELNNKFDGSIIEPLIRSNFIGTSGVIVDREVFRVCGGFDMQLRSIQDWDLWLRIAANNPISYTDEPLVLYRVHSESTSRSARKTLPNHMRVINKTFSKGGAGEKLHHLKAFAKANSFGICAHIAEEEGDLGFALGCSFKSACSQPAKPSAWVMCFKMFVKYGLNLTGLRKA
ncbi:glycosyltransferase [Teredinibacter purpureus]|uniref:glycosyltransferase n=1 Tax=Teredinibacter purpureus TaxID=2731756 RepID=UPI0006967CFA|nr:glycosyltransferase [Teredinibacter purpureus]